MMTNSYKNIKLTSSIQVKFLKQRECLFTQENIQISKKNYNKIHENSQVLYEIRKNIHVLTYEY